MVVSNRYANSLFELAKSENILDEVYSNLDGIYKAFKDNKELFDVLCSPSIKDFDKTEIVSKVFKGQVHEYTKNFLCVLITKKRINLFFGIKDEFSNIYNDEKNIEYAKITTAIELDSSSKEKLLEKLSKDRNKEIKALFSVDEDILGGVIVAFNNKIIDGSIKTKLSNLNKQM